MSETTAKAKYSCPACGAEAVWNPGRQALICSYCSTVSPAHLDPTPGGDEVIVEHDLGKALRGMPDTSRGWQARKTSVRCQSCQAISVFDESVAAQRCNFCGSASLVAYDQIKDSFRPESLLPLKVSETQVRETIRTWYGSRWFAPGKLGNKALTDQIKGVYIPYWTFDANVYARWEAVSGYYYYETQRVRNAQGQEQTVRVQKIRWQDSQGELEHFFDDDLVCASKGVDPELLPKVDGFPTDKLVPYNAGFLAGWLVERYQIDLVTAADRSRKAMERQLERLCARQVPGDTFRDLRISADWSGQTFKHILAPIWLLTYDYGSRQFQVVVNGYTGEIAGRHPLSFWKIFFAVIGGLILVFLLIWMTQGG